MGELVIGHLADAAVALANQQQELVDDVIDGDQKVDELYREIESQCIDLFALQQPVASDLRRVASAFKIATDLERIGDLAVNLAQYSDRLNRDLYTEIALASIIDMASQMVADAIEIYLTDADAWECHELADRDTELDAMCVHASRVVTRALINHNTTDDSSVEGLIEDVSVLLLTIRDLERIGDHAVNVAARTLYTTEGSDSLLD
jgi:phosphate transport system protein